MRDLRSEEGGVTVIPVAPSIVAIPAMLMLTGGYGGGAPLGGEEEG
jgi:hypothetical protein